MIADLSDVEGEFLVSWVEEPPPFSPTRLTNILEYPSPVNEERNTNIYPRSGYTPDDPTHLLELSVDQFVQDLLTYLKQQSQT